MRNSPTTTAAAPNIIQGSSNLYSDTANATSAGSSNALSTISITVILLALIAAGAGVANQAIVHAPR